MSATAMRKVTWEARAMASTSECTNHLAGEGATLDGVDASRSSSSSYGGGDPGLDGVDASSTSGSGGDGPMIDVSSRDEEDI
jgi:hypothetical protein